MVDFKGPLEGGVFVLELNDGKDNRFSAEVFKKFNDALDAVEKNEGPTSVVITGSGKFFSNGFVMDYLMTETEQALGKLHSLFARLLELKVPSICAINGHAYAGASMIALCCDLRVMNEEKGFYCANELLIGLPFTEAMTAVFSAKLTPSARSRVMLGAEKFTGKTALAERIVEYAVPAAEVLPTAMKMAKVEAAKGDNKETFQIVKQRMYGAAIAQIRNSTIKIPLPKL